MLVFDLPTSYLADLIGRKKCIIIGIFLTSISIFLMFFGQGFLVLSLIYILAAIGLRIFSRI